LEISPEDEFANDQKLNLVNSTKEDGINSKPKWARRADVVNKTLIRALKKIYSKKLCPTEIKLTKLNSPEAMQTLENIDSVSQKPLII
jgi:hypothetical protein